MDLTNKYEIVKAMIVGQRLRITGGPCTDANVHCIGFERWGDHPDQYDILTSSGRIGCGIDEIHPGGFSGKTVTLSKFVRKVEILGGVII